MPRVSNYPIVERKTRTQACIERHMRLNNIEVPAIAKRMNVSEQTIYRWIQNPEVLTLLNLWHLATILKCPIGELAGGEMPEELIGSWIKAAMNQ